MRNSRVYTRPGKGHLDILEPAGPIDPEGYETVFTVYSNLEITAGEKIKNTSIKLIEKLKPGKIPEFAEGKPAEQAWSYETLGPDLE